MSLIVAVLICSLGDPRYPVREAAQDSLVKLGTIAEPQLIASRNHSDPETRSRIHKILCPWRTRTIQSSLLNRKDLPWIDALPKHFPDRLNWIGYYRGCCTDFSCENEPYPNDRGATRKMIIELVDDWEPEKILDLIKVMDARCPFWSMREYRYTD